MKHIFTLALLCFSLTFSAQTDEQAVETIFKNSLNNGMSYQWLDHLSNQIGGRLSGSLNAERAVAYTKEEFEKLGLDKVWLQPVMVPRWVRGAPEFAYIETSPGVTTNVNICALGGSIATPGGGIKANIIEVGSYEDLKDLGEEKIKGKIVFINRPMQADLINTFEAYGGCSSERYRGAAEAAKYGAVGTIVRSLNLRLDDYPHTGSMSYGDLPPSQRIPSAAISTNDAELLSGMLALNKDLKFFFSQNCKQLEDVLSYNVIGEITGSEYPNEIILVGGHLDSWDLGDGSHDDGAGCVQSMDVLRLLKESGLKPKRTIRAVLFMNEENGLRGGRKYAEEAKAKNEKHIFALESDSGGFTPRGFSFQCSEAMLGKVQSWRSLFKPYLIHFFEMGYSGADIGPLRNDEIVLAGLRPDSQRYFDHHHAANDTFEHVNKRELELGAASMTALVFLIDKYGTNTISNVEEIRD
ncbi:M20/M25/M40 family metallo-hydrolase [Psychroserpens sp.]|uniref:M20/M25/M40 family metallo-hydrolase n=1 Tax=Psychroserpens sp. TaxID=2020870 RepID=UPI001B00503B|nr:M20/M25/M40 family metallo-hydrolase [Psychroserpens sp.]MBO6607151.1 M20/M25/M40 family metallo-hydrolase [Psychroserpens sp.]MBO6654297.1 M20/M25/M40 family metallo-hydrolase [Psychroserpens sp.]MBO6682417.1 M20/M25/M40 family metallo-hydrolase [Psychroserpens sp.]MBO6750923.1 M20/M25/M40 family metallo-hydrolase [Psychroserpens sp.]MBO6915648.1 M20/M25/M40 family metallo-hydrolase [Psychroserpens sp.]